MEWYEFVGTFISSIVTGLKSLTVPGVGLPVFTFLAGIFCFKILISVMKTLLGIGSGMSGLSSMSGDIVQASGSVYDSVNVRKNAENKRSALKRSAREQISADRASGSNIRKNKW